MRFDFGTNPAYMTEPVKCKGTCGEYVDRSGRGREASFQREGRSFCRPCVYVYDDMKARGVPNFCADCDTALAKSGYTQQSDGRWICAACVTASWERGRERMKLERRGQAGLFAAPVEVEQSVSVAAVVVEPVFAAPAQNSLF